MSSTDVKGVIDVKGVLGIGRMADEY